MINKIHMKPIFFLFEGSWWVHGLTFCNLENFRENKFVITQRDSCDYCMSTEFSWMGQKEKQWEENFYLTCKCYMFA